MRIVLDEGYLPFTEGRFTSHEVSFFSRNLTSAEEFVDRISDAEVLGLRVRFAFSFDRTVITRLPSVRFIHKTGTGAEWFDAAELSNCGILLATNHGLNASNVAEHAVTLILLTMRNTWRYVERMRTGEWNHDHMSDGVIPVRGKTVGIIGLGASGSYVAKAMLGLGARVLAYQRKQPPGFEILSGITWSSLDDLLRQSDIVTLHLPLNTSTNKLIGKREFDLMKHGAVFINCARGGIVDEAALIEALGSGRLRAAGIDVFEEEPTPPDNPLLKFDNVIATPHVAGSSAGFDEIQIQAALDNIETFLSGRRPTGIANPEVLTNGCLRASHLESHCKV